MKKRILSIFLCVCLICGLLPTTTLAADTIGSWGDFYDVDYLNNIINNYESRYNTEDDALRVSTPEQLAAVAVFSNMDYSHHFAGKYVELTADIDISEHSWIPIAIPQYEIDGEPQIKFYRSYGFAGDFIGNGHSVTGLTLNNPEDSLVGLFGAIAPNGIVSSLKVSGTIVGTWNLGGIAAHNYGGTISNCETDLDISTSGYCVGGIVGQNSGTIINCTAQGNINSELLADLSAGGNVGGIAGYSSGSISGCQNESNITGTTRVGGIVGRAQNASSISNCTNTGTINALDSCGGIVGFVDSASAQIAECCNTGNIAIIENDNVTQYACAGGIVGSNVGLVLSCVNEGNVECFDQDNRAGGIIGFNQGTVKYSVNKGNISSKLTGKTVCGGIVGYLYLQNGHPVIEQCYNQGSVATGRYSGGISGFAASDSTITNSYNTGSVSSSVYAAGISAFNNATMSHCYNVGDIDGTQSEGGIIAVVGVVGTDVVSDCYYLDTCGVGIGAVGDSTGRCTMEQMKQQSTYAGFDFGDQWTMESNEDYPYPKLEAIEIYTQTGISKPVVTLHKSQYESAGTYLEGEYTCPVWNANTKIEQYNAYWEKAGASGEYVRYAANEPTFQSAGNPTYWSGLWLHEDGSYRVRVQAIDTDSNTAVYSDWVYFTVVPYEPEVPVKTIEIAKEVTLKVGESITLTPSVSPVDAEYIGFMWSIDDYKVATIAQKGWDTNKGWNPSATVTACEPGIAYISVFTRDGEVAAFVKVTVVDENAIDITLDIPNENPSAVTVNAPEGGWKEGENTFTVSSNKTSRVFVSYDGGQTYTRLTASAEGDAHSFTADNMTADTILTVLTAGDVSGDGNINIVDISKLCAASLGKTSISPLRKANADTNGDGNINIVDISKLCAVSLGKSSLSW